MIENIGKLGAGMSGTTPESQNSTLLDGPQDGAKPDASVIVQVAQKFGVSPAKQSRDDLVLSNGQTRKVTDFAKEVFERYPSGYLLKTALDPHPDMAAMSGDTLGSVRFVAINDGPAHGLYQQAAVRGVLNADFNPIWGSVIAHQKKRLARYKSTKKNVKG